MPMVMTMEVTTVVMTVTMMMTAMNAVDNEGDKTESSRATMMRKMTTKPMLHPFQVPVLPLATRSVDDGTDARSSNDGPNEVDDGDDACGDGSDVGAHDDCGDDGDDNDEAGTPHASLQGGGTVVRLVVTK